MLVGRLTKETTDIRRVIVDFTPWLDLGETISALGANQIIYGNSGWSSTQPPWQASEVPYDPTPLVFVSDPTIVNTNTAVQFFAKLGTPGSVYTVQIVAIGTSGRVATMEVMVQLSGIPPTQTLVPIPPALFAYLPLSGGTITGNLTVTGTINGSGGSFLPLAGGTLSGRLTLPTLTLGSTPVVLGTGIGQVPLFSNYQGSGFPGFTVPGRLIISQTAPTAADFAVLQLQRTTSFTGGSSLSQVLRVSGTYGAHDTNQNWALVSVATTNGIDGGLIVGTFSQANLNLGGTDPIWGSISEARDHSALASSGTGQIIGMEIDLRTGKADNGFNGRSFGHAGLRKALNIVIGRDDITDVTPAEISHGLWFTQSLPTDNPDLISFMDSAIGFGTDSLIIQALDTRGATAPAAYANPVAAVRMSAGQIIDFFGGPALNSAPGRSLVYNAGGTKLQYLNAATEMFSVSDAGNALVAGTLGVTGAITGASYKAGANQVVGARVTGYAAMTGTPDKATAFTTSTVTLAQLAGRVMQMQADLTNHGLIGT